MFPLPFFSLLGLFSMPACIYLLCLLTYVLSSHQIQMWYCFYCDRGTECVLPWCAVQVYQLSLSCPWSSNSLTYNLSPKHYHLQPWQPVSEMEGKLHETLWGAKNFCNSQVPAFWTLFRGLCGSIRIVDWNESLLCMYTGRNFVSAVIFKY